MSAANITIKRHNHRIHPCPPSKKQELLQHLSEVYKDHSILIISDANRSTSELPEKNITLSNDTELSKMGSRSWDVLISFDLPKAAEEYLERLSHATKMALILVAEDEQTRLYPIETLLGKNITREVIKGFEPAPADIKKRTSKPTKSQQLSAKENETKKKNQIDKKQPFSAKKEWNKKTSSAAQNNTGKKPKVIKIPSEKQKKS